MDIANYPFPLNAVDTRNKPPMSFLYVQDGCVLVMGSTWTLAYALYIRQGRKDNSYGMPIVALCANLAWEIIYGIFYPLSTVETSVFITWIVIDLFVMHTTLKSGPREFEHAPLIAKHIGLILPTGTALLFLLHWAFIETCPDLDVASFYSGFTCQVLLGLSSIAQIATRNSVRGHSLTIWALRTIGSLAAAIMFNWRYTHYPDDYAVVRTPVAVFLTVTATLGDLLYLVVFLAVRRQNRTKVKEH